jgi:MerR family transcriptional regulator, heat shock protein HspR
VKHRFFTKDAARLVGVHPQTLRGWDRRGLISPVRDWRGARIFTAADVEKARALAGTTKGSPTT